jgi:phage terminase small subunit
LRPLTPKQERFVNEYLVDLNATGAAIRAGYSRKTANRIGPELLGKPWVAEAIGRAKDERAKNVGIDAAWVLQELRALYDAHRFELYGPDQKLKPISQWPERLRQLFRGVKKGQLVFEGHPVQVLELIGKHVNVRGFVQRHDVHIAPVTIKTENQVDLKLLSDDELVAYRRIIEKAAKRTTGTP